MEYHDKMRFIRRRCGLRQVIVIAALFVLSLTYKLYRDHHWLHHVLDVIIVEEHHEVLPYWFRAAWSGKLQLRHNTLLHIDAHADASPPEPTPYFPMFRTPNSMWEVRNMMQRNDVFIIGSVISELVSRVIWTWPSWDAGAHDVDSMHNILQVGTTRQKMKAQDDPELAFCSCISNSHGTECSFMNRTDPLDDAFINETECAVRIKGVFENARDNVTMANLRRSDEWIPHKSSSSSSSFILDFDEDFFGTESPADVILLESGLQWKQILQVTDITSQLFCPTSVKAETASDQLVGALIDAVVMDCKTPFHPNLPYQSGKGGACETVLKDISSFVEAFLQRTLDVNLNLLCSGDKAILLRRIKSLANLFISFDALQLKTLQRVGFCMRASPNTLYFEHITEFHTFGVCCGWNTPNDTVVTYHYPGSSEINFKLKQLQRMLATRNFPTPGIVTIARSMRDGYTSKRHFDLIEDGLIQILGSVFPEKELRIVYDESLMSGKKGRRWQERIHPKTRGIFS